MIYFQNKYLSDKLNINLAKWKRWSREFLDPDPLGGLRSGYARQYSYRDAFVVYLGGVLVGTFQFGIPQARQILHDLDPWLKSQGYFALPDPKRSPRAKSSQIRIFALGVGQFGFDIRIYAQDRAEADGETFNDALQRTLINIRPDDDLAHQATHAWVLYIDNLHQTFLNQIDS